MPETTVGQVARLAVEGTLNGSQVVNVFHYVKTGNPNPTLSLADLADLCGQWQFNCQSSYLAFMSNEYTLNRYSARTVLAPVQISELVPGTPQPQGASLVDALANQTAAIVTWRTAYAGRRYRGRSYLPGTNDNELVNGRFNAGAIALFDTWANEARSFASSDDLTWDLVILSDPDGLLPATMVPGAGQVAPTWDYVISHVSRDIPGTQRRRRIGVGS